MTNVRRVSYVFLCSVPFLCFVMVGTRAFRVSGVHQAIGVAYFAAIAIAAWIHSGGAIRTDGQGRRLLNLAGTLLVTLAVAGFLAVALDERSPATPPGNQVGHLSLIVMATVIAGGFVVLRGALSEAGERFHLTLGFAAIMLSGPLYLIWNTFAFAILFGEKNSTQVPASILSLDDMLDLLLLGAGFLTYLATLAFAASLGRVQWPGRSATRAFMIANGIALLLLMIRGLQYPDPTALSTPWYINRGLVVSIPVVPFIMPLLLGVVLVRRAGE
jgi:hypothetical protein